MANRATLTHVGAVILAGGLGKRIGHLYPFVPKPMIEVCGFPFLEWVIRYFAGQGVAEFSLSLGYKAEIIEEYLRRRQADGLRIHSVREDIPLGTGGGFLLAAGELLSKDYLVVANGDSLILADLLPAVELLSQGQADAVIVGRQMEDCSRFGSLVCDDKGFLVKFSENQDGNCLINAGIYIFPKGVSAIFPRKSPLSFETDVFPGLLHSGARVGVVESGAPFLDIGTPESVAEAEAFISAQRAKINYLWEKAKSHE
ncbi:MAG TPA: sugar phosphate nucleotidyltransferase [Thermodesulfovibrionales bacterium]|nr:sugar phosphate nucleotidyltransferase [Thermodesulfovibrionales bacterium]